MLGPAYDQLTELNARDQDVSAAIRTLTDGLAFRIVSEREGDPIKVVFVP